MQKLDDNFKFKKKFGQNFLIDNNIINNIVNKADIKEDSLVIEIGPGSGALTTFLATSAKNVLCYEIDESLKETLSKIQNEHHNVEIIYNDFLNTDVQKDIKKYSFKNLYVIANLPYYITTPIIQKIIDEKLPLNKMVIMIQKEVGERFNAKVGTKNYNSLTIFLNYNFIIKKLFDVSRNAFVPRPNVDSVVLELKKYEFPDKVVDENHFFKLVRDSFRFKRKNLKNNLSNYDLDIICNVLGSYDLDLTVRAENLTINQFVEISNAIKLSK